MNNQPNNFISENKKHHRSLRSRLVLGNMVITFLAILGMGLYVYYRAQQANDYLTTQLSESVYQQAQDKLSATSTEQTLQLNNFFTSIRKDISNLGVSLGKLLSPTNSNVVGYWDATLALHRLPNGSWDNSNNEIASVFIPAAMELSPLLNTELNAARQIDFIVPPLLDTNQDVIAIYFGGLYGETIYYPNIDLATIVPSDFDVTQRPWFLNASPVINPEHASTWSEPYLDAALNGLVITCSTPVYSDDGVFRGVTAMDIQLNRITDLVANIHVGDTGYALLLDKDRRLIAMPASGYQDLGIIPETLPLGEIISQEKVANAASIEFWDVIAEMASGNSGLETISIGGNDRFIIFQPVSEIGYSLAIIVPTQELLADAIAANEQIAQVTQNTLLISILLIGIVLIVALLAALGIGNRLTRPLISLIGVAEEISRGNLNAEAVVTTQDEIGTLARAFNSMTARLRDMIENLEKRVADRTLALERRTSQIQAAVEVGNAVASVRNLEELLTRVTRLISQRFGFYHVGIFLLDDRDEFAVLRASNSPGGQRMLEHEHKLRVGQVGIVGYVTSSGNARIALDVGEDAVFFDNPDLPETRSEMALPLAIGSRIIGALDVQSTQENAFSEEDIQTLRLLADQTAIAIDNARLFSESQKAIETTKRAYGDMARSQWQELFREKSTISGMTILPKGQIVPASGDASPEFEKAMASGSPVISEDATTIYIPIKVMGNALGAIRLARKNNSRWTTEDINTAISLSAQLSTALESARLYEQIIERAKRESLVTDITSKIGSSIELDTIMQTTVEEISKLFKGSEVVLQLKKESGK
jgi:GAF domain-containing protein/HAMP domain-containing protein